MSWQRGMSRFKVGVIALVLIAVGSYLGFTKSIPFTPAFEIKAAFRSSNSLKTNSPVRIAGVTIGTVTKVEPTSPGASAAIVTMEIKDAGRPIHTDATAKIRPRIFLEGNFFVDVTSGSPDKSDLGDGDLIPASQTATPVQLDQVLKALQTPTRVNLQDTLSELGKAEQAGAAKAFNKTLDDQAPAFRYTSIVAEALLGRRPHDLSGIVRDLGTTAAALDRSPQALQSLVVDFDTTAAALASERGNLQDTVSELPRTLAAAKPALDSLNASFPDVRRFAMAALPGTRSSLPAVRALRPFIAQLDGLVREDELRGLTRDLRGTTPAAVRLAKRTVPLLGQLRPLASCMNTTVLPWTHDTVPDKAHPATGPVYQALVKFLPGLAGESRSFDANGQWFKVLGAGGLETVQLGNGFFGFPLLPISGVNPPKPQSRPPLRPDVACETQKQPDLHTVPEGPPTEIIDVNGVLQGVKDTVGGLIPDAVKGVIPDVAQAAIASSQRAFKRAGGKVSDKPVTRDMIEQLAKRNGNMDQLETLRKGLPLTPENIAKAGDGG